MPAEALGWGALAASSLILGAVLGLATKWPERLVGAVLAFGAGALISAVSFDLAEEGLQIGDPAFVAAGLGIGAIAFYVLDGAFDRGGTNALALGAFLDGIPEQLVLGIGLAVGDGTALGCWRRSSSRTCPRRSARPTRCALPGRLPPRSAACGA